MTDRVTLIATLAQAEAMKRGGTASDYIPDAVRFVRHVEEAERAEWGMKSRDIPRLRASEDDAA